jgi:membrane protein YdbS with pleckstrin-like domain
MDGMNPSSPTEETIWEGASSQWLNFWPWLSCVLVVTLPWALWRWLAVRARRYQLTSERLKIASGVLNRTIETLELYRVKDIAVTQPFMLRLAGLENITLLTSDHTSPTVTIPAMRQADALGDKFRRQVEIVRDRKRVREVDFDQIGNEAPGA